MSTVKLRYIGGIPYVDVPILSREGDDPLEEHGAGCVVRGEVFECDKEIAGRPPKLNADGTLKLGDDSQPVDPGEGLLAQPSNFELVKPAAARKRRKAAAKKPNPSPPMPPASPTADDHQTAEA